MAPTAAEIIERVKGRRAACRTYQDEGEQTRHFKPTHPMPIHQPHTRRLKFRTAFERGGPFKFEYRASLLSQNEADWMHGVIWSDEKRVQSCWSIPSPFDTRVDLDHAFGALQGMSRRTSSEIPSMLFTQTRPHVRIATFGPAAVWPSAAFEGAWCMRLAEAWPTQKVMLTVWIEEAMGLVRRTDETHEFTS